MLGQIDPDIRHIDARLPDDGMITHRHGAECFVRDWPDIVHGGIIEPHAAA